MTKPASPILLALEASGRRASVAVMAKAGDVSVAEQQGLHGHAQHIIALLMACLDDAAIPAKAITHVAVGCGPGSFTGIRTALATAKGVGLALRLPVYGMGSLDGLARLTDRPAVFVGLDSRRHGYFVRLYHNGEAVTPIVEMSGTSIPAAMLTKMKHSSDSLSVIGHDSQKLADALAQSGVAVADTTETDAHAAAIAQMAWAVIGAGKPAQSYPATAQYHTPVLLGGKKT